MRMGFPPGEVRERPWAKFFPPNNGFSEACGDYVDLAIAIEIAESRAPMKGLAGQGFGSKFAIALVSEHQIGAAATCGRSLTLRYPRHGRPPRKGPYIHRCRDRTCRGVTPEWPARARQTAQRGHVSEFAAADVPVPKIKFPFVVISHAGIQRHVAGCPRYETGSSACCRWLRKYPRVRRHPHRRPRRSCPYRDRGRC